MHPPDDAKKAAARLGPVVDRNRCEGHAACVAVCPEGVFVLGRLDAPQRATLSPRGRLRAWLHGGTQAFLPRLEACTGCGKCALACPKNAIVFKPWLDAVADAGPRTG